MTTNERQDLRAILNNYGVPDPGLVSKLAKNYKDKNGRWQTLELDYVGHAELTRILIEIDPEWNWEPIEWNGGRPAMNVVNGVASMWGRLTVLGKTVIGVGTAPADKADLDKELIGDFLRNAGMRLGIALSLWSKAEWDEHDSPAPSRHSTTTTANQAVGEVIADPFEWAHHAFINANSIAELNAAADLAKKRLTDEQRGALREIYLERKTELEAGE